MSKILRNRAKCRQCGQVVESIGRHDFVTCPCGAIFVDGGHAYIRRGAADPSDIIEMSVFEENKKEVKSVDKKEVKLIDKIYCGESEPE